jgi:hypothetical protein
MSSILSSDDCGIKETVLISSSVDDQLLVEIGKFTKHQEIKEYVTV